MKRVELYIALSPKWHYSPKEPKHDGFFWAVTKYGRIQEFMYTVEGGWNTHHKEDGTVEPNPDREEWLDYIRAWTYGKDLISAKVVE